MTASATLRGFSLWYWVRNPLAIGGVDLQASAMARLSLAGNFPFVSRPGSCLPLIQSPLETVVFSTGGATVLHRGEHYTPRISEGW